MMNVHNTFDQKRIIIINSAVTGEEIYIIIVNVNSTINECFNKLMEDNFDHRLKESDIKIIYESSMIYSYYDQTIGNRSIKELDLFEKNLEICEIHVSLLFSDSFMYMPNDIIINFELWIPRITHVEISITNCHSYQNLNDSRKQEIDRLLSLLHSNNILDYNIYKYFYENIIITKFILIILLKKKIVNISISILFNQINEDFSNDRELIEISINKLGNFYLQFASTKLRADKEIIRQAILQNKFYIALKFASNELRADKEIVKIAVLQNESSLQFASNKLQSDSEIVKIAVYKNGWTLKFASTELQSDKEIVKIAVSQNGLALQFASTILRADKEIVKLAVNCNSLAIEFASIELRADREIVEIAVLQNCSTIVFASKELQADREIVIIAVKNRYPLYNLSSILLADREIIEIGIKVNYNNLKYASTELQDDRELIKLAISLNAIAIKYASNKLRADREIIKIAIKKNYQALQFASIELQSDREIVQIACFSKWY